MTKAEAVQTLEERTYELLAIDNLMTLKHSNLITVFSDMLLAIRVLKTDDEQA